MDKSSPLPLTPGVSPAGPAFVQAIDERKSDASDVMDPIRAPLSHHPITYRPDIDGLRALAVVPVVLFHAYPKALPGGFIGVDIFFVISGFLISSILFKEHARGTFTYADFYSRRIRRIFPALILVLAVTLTLGCLWLLAKPLKQLASTMIAGCLFGANIQLMKVEQTYGDATLTADNPLLHLWSLGVEEQFYIFWPLFASLVVRLPLRLAILAQLVVLVSSFICNVALIGFHGDNKYAFYFPLSRFWQMSIGGLLAYANMPTHTTVVTPPSPLASSVLSVVGLAAIVNGFCILDEGMNFPGYWALLPTLGAAALIFAGPDTPLNKYILGSKPMAFIGHISYALYLWHWPLLVFAKVRYPVAALRAWFWEPYSMALVAVGLSIATLYLVENHLRRRKSRYLTAVLFALVMGLMVVAIVVYKAPDSYSALSRSIAGAKKTIYPDLVPTNSSGEPINWSKPPRVAEITAAKIMSADDYFDFSGFVQLEAGQTDLMPKALNLNTSSGRVVVILGDSHANMLAPRFKRLLELAKAANESFPTVYLRARSNTPSLSCTAEHASDVAFIHATRPDAVLISSNWIKFLRAQGQGTTPSPNPQCCRSGYTDPCLYQSRADVVEMLRQLQVDMLAFAAIGIRVFVTTSNPEGDAFSWQNMLNGAQVSAVAPIRRSAFRQDHHDILSIVENAIAGANATLIDLSDNQCYDDLCQVVSMREGEPMFWDTEHIRPYYARNYATCLDQVIHAALA
ncbi:Aste57867_8258 [Aphanomyces stellatus]|uniref:Aste57867_8258 protein n=1 Tax=Aphanomyces stellatus TaxID=120398 RepID=A0A485KJT3_9STRA|nr:hypothetical protein As57867_008227 [Aphanomyces stellatus]VFT85145.1 Aste57867_8258 [Aphanomyces stellatus]